MCVRQLPASALVLLHLAPGAAGTLVYIAFAGRVTEAGYPPLAALLLAIATVIVPIELAVLGLAHARNRGQGEPLIAYGAHLRLVEWAKLIPALLQWDDIAAQQRFIASEPVGSSSPRSARSWPEPRGW